ncbi:MAG: threonylcarbamoyl-AMP synthase [Chitinophagaceae bacterium]|nr:MAG: threonylcarbamoyl-AMP synthase [Chitinophagaceae bacterium]
MNFNNDIEKCVAVLESGGIVLYPTDTIWGIGCDATNSEAVAKIYQLKNRADEKAMIVLVAQENEVLKYVEELDLKVFDYLKTVQKPTTVVYENATHLAKNLLGKDGSIGIRICKDDFCRELINRFKKPIVSTSANKSGDEFPKNFEVVDIAIRNGVDYIVQYRQDDKKNVTPSSVVKWKNGEAQVLRS